MFNNSLRIQKASPFFFFDVLPEKAEEAVRAALPKHCAPTANLTGRTLPVR